MEQYIKRTAKNSKKYKSLDIHGVPVERVDELAKYIDLEQVKSSYEQLIPKPLVRNIDAFYIIDMEKINNGKTEFNALYDNGAIYVSRFQDSEKDLLDDIIHETAHSLEIPWREHIYGDSLLEKEFLGKRNYLYYQMEDRLGEITKEDFMNLEYSSKFDEFLFLKLSYNYLRNITSNLFYSPYAITSLREYWSNGFENYFVGDKRKLKDLSPLLYSKIEQMVQYD